MECAPGAGGLRAAAAPKRSCIGSFVLVAVVALPLSMFGDCLSDVCPVTSAYHSINGALHVNETLGLDEGLTYELPKSLMLVTGVFALCVGVASLLAGARLAQSLFALLLGALAGVVAVQHLAPELLLDQPHLEIELVPTRGGGERQQQYTTRKPPIAGGLFSSARFARCPERSAPW